LQLLDKKARAGRLHPRHASAPPRARAHEENYFTQKTKLIED
jgi:hypothetical protein